jgi:pimeloyl-ACP methyl ester carboxylesterase
VAGLHAAYPKADVADVLTSEAISREAILNMACARDVLADYATAPQPITVNDPTTIQPWAQLLARNSAGNRSAGAPVLVIQGDADRTIPKSLTDQFIAKACAVGDTLEYRVYPGTDHNGSLGAAKADFLAFISSRIAGDEPTTTC